MDFIELNKKKIEMIRKLQNYIKACYLNGISPQIEENFTQKTTQKIIGSNENELIKLEKELIEMKLYEN